MGSGQQRLDQIADIEFHGKVPRKVNDYAKATQRLAHDLARELANAEDAAETAMRELDGHPLLLGVDVKARAWWVSRHLREAREIAQGISAEAVKFNLQFRQEFITQVQRPTKRKDYKGTVDL